jgi:hypothetical protein
MHTYNIHTILLALYYLDMFSLQRAILREYNRLTKYVPDVQ